MHQLKESSHHYFRQEIQSRLKKLVKAKKKFKMDRKLFAQLLIATQVRGGDVQEHFEYETRRKPPSLSKEGKIRPDNKANLLPCFKNNTEFPIKESIRSQSVVLEGSMLVNMLKPNNC